MRNELLNPATTRDQWNRAGVAAAVFSPLLPVRVDALLNAVISAGQGSPGGVALSALGPAASQLSAAAKARTAAPALGRPAKVAIGDVIEVSPAPGRVRAALPTGSAQPGGDVIDLEFLGVGPDGARIYGLAQDPGHALVGARLGEARPRLLHEDPAYQSVEVPLHLDARDAVPVVPVVRGAPEPPTAGIGSPTAGIGGKGTS